MTLVTCGECSQQVSNKAKTCPHCGVPFSAAATPPPVKRGSPSSGQAVILLVAVLVLAAVVPTAWDTSATRLSPQPPPRPIFVADNGEGSDGCTVLGDYCMSVSCYVTNVGNAGGSVAVMAEIFEDDKRVGTRRETTILAPGQRDTVSFKFPEAQMSKHQKYRCSVDPLQVAAR